MAMLGTKAQWRTFAYLVGCAFLVSSVAFINRYPLVYSDSGTYIRSAFTLLPPDDRPIGYGLIIRAVTWQSTLWTVVLFQGAMISWLLYETLKQLLPVGMVIWRAHLILLALLMTLTSMPWYMAQVMPDAITPMIGLILYLLFMGVGISLPRKILLWSSLFFFMITHNSHVAMGLLFMALAAIYALARRRYVQKFWITWGAALATVIGGVIFVAQYNGANGLRTEFSPSAHVFLAGRLCEGELMGDFLDEHCGERHYALCPYKDELPVIPGDLIWGPNSIRDRLGGNLSHVDSLLKPVVRDLFAEPEFLGRYVRMCVVASVTQLFQVNTNSGIVSFYKDSSPYAAIQERLPWEASMYITSLQAHNAWANLEFHDHIVHLVLLLSVLSLLWWWRQAGSVKGLHSFIIIMLVWVVLNAVVTASLANVYDRLQSRVAWLTVLSAIIVIMSTPWGERMLVKYASRP
jgi:hypothetical protein